VLSHRFLRERRGLEDRDDDGAGHGLGLLPGVDGERLESGLAGSLLHDIASMPRPARGTGLACALPCARISGALTLDEGIQIRTLLEGSSDARPDRVDQ